MGIHGFGKYTGSEIHLITFRHHNYEVLVMYHNDDTPSHKKKVDIPKLTMPKKHDFFTAKTAFFRKKLTKGSVILIKGLGTGMVVRVDPDKDHLYVDFVNWKVIPVALYMLPELYMQRKFMVLRDCDGKRIELAKPKTSNK